MGPIMMDAVAIVDGTPAQRTTCDRFDVVADHYLINHDFFDPDFIFAALRCDECKILLNVSPSDGQHRYKRPTRCPLSTGVRLFVAHCHRPTLVERIRTGASSVPAAARGARG